ncbi:MAG: helix-turn-helix domain-containing protein [Leptolyngbyaceae bacterium]|nr:helix-turn-helix domain-containing protein [Leptolyngbyaceae bacterium]
MNAIADSNEQNWELSTQSWNTQAIRLLEWIEGAEACLEKARDTEFSPSLASEIKLNLTQLDASKQILEEILQSSEKLVNDSGDHASYQEFEGNLAKVEARINSLHEELVDLINENIINSPKEAELFINNHIEPIPTGAPFMSSIESQLRTDLWYEKDGIAVFSKIAKNNPQNYIEHYISSPGDVTMLPWDAAEKIINNFGFNTVKLQLILAAHAMNQNEPWSGSFTLSGDDVIKNLGWNNRKDLTVSQKLSELAGCAFALDCLLVRVEWKEGQTSRRRTQVTVQTSRMWNISVSATGQKNLLSDKIETLDKVELQVQPGLWTKGFLNRGGAKAKQALYQFGYLAQSVLKIDPYHNELALRLAIHLTIESRIHKSGEYRVKTLLQSVLVGYDAKLEKAYNDRHKARDIVHQWNEALKTLQKLGWSITFDDNYPESLRPGSKVRKPKGYLKILIESKLTIKPPEPIPELLGRKRNTKSLPSQKKKTPPPSATTTQMLTGDMVRSARKTKGWSQAKLAGFLGVSQQLISHIESGRRDPTPDIEARLKKILKIT